MYLQNPYNPLMWESDGAAPWGKYRAKDGSVHDTAQEAVERNHEVDKKELLEWDSISTDEVRKALK